MLVITLLGSQLTSYVRSHQPIPQPQLLLEGSSILGIYIILRLLDGEMDVDTSSGRYSVEEESILCAKGQSDLTVINVLFVCDEWKPLKGGLTTFNRELALNLALSKNFKVFCYVAQSDEEDRKDASKHGVNLITAKSIPGSTDPLDHLKIPPKLPIDIVIGHGRKVGYPVYFIAERISCKWIHFVHVFCRDLGKFKKATRSTLDTIDENESKHKLEIQLCEAADVVVGVGCGLQDKYRKCLPGTQVQVLTPGILESFASQPRRLLPEAGPLDEHSPIVTDDFNVCVFGRVTAEDLFVKGYDIIAKAIAFLEERFKLTCVGSQRGKQREIEAWFLKKTGIKREQLTICPYCNQEEVKRMLYGTDSVVLPSRVEGFGMAALEAISAAIPVLISKPSGIALTLRKVKGGDSVVVANQEPEEWARRIEELSRKAPQERYDNAIDLRENYRRVYPWNSECERFKGIIEDLFKGRKTKQCVFFICPCHPNPQVHCWVKQLIGFELKVSIQQIDSMSLCVCSVLIVFNKILDRDWFSVCLIVM